MAQHTAISWTNHTFNPWIGCAKTSAGCLNCYAQRQNDARYHWINRWGVDYRRTSAANWQQPLKWARQARQSGLLRRVFCASLADIFDDQVPASWRADLWRLIETTADPASPPTSGLEWLLLTKRIENAAAMLPPAWVANPPPYIRLGVTVENQQHLHRIPDLLAVWSGPNFISVEPMLSPLDITAAMQPIQADWSEVNALDDDSEPEELIEECEAEGDWINYGNDLVINPDYRDWMRRRSHLAKLAAMSRQIDWVIAGAESGPAARPCDLDWLRSLRDQCAAANVPFFLKQMTLNGRLVKMPALDGRVWSCHP